MATDREKQLEEALRTLLSDAEEIHQELNAERRNVGLSAWPEEPSFAVARDLLPETGGDDE